MLQRKKRAEQSQVVTIGTAEAFYQVFLALPKKDRIAVARYIMEDEIIRQYIETPNETTLQAFAEDKTTMPVFHNIDHLRKDLLD